MARPSLGITLYLSGVEKPGAMVHRQNLDVLGANPVDGASGIDEVSRRKGHHYLTVVYDLERRVLLWVGQDRTTETLAAFFGQLGRRRCSTIRVVCMDMVRWNLPVVRAYYLKEAFQIVLGL